ncbi:MAG TPA: carbohydrate ABC transporter permease [Ruminiclostridium sp.]|nr:carbohydrate ABC transporter permease [Ruminiclostridium sp.]
MKKHTLEKSSLYLALAVLVILFLFPIYWVVTMSFKNPGQIFVVPPEFFPSSFHLGNYAAIFQRSMVSRYFTNSLFIAVCTTILSVFIASFAGYGFSRFRFRGRNFAIYGIMVIRIVPVVVYIVPFYVIYKQLGLLNTYPGLMLAYTTFSLSLAIWLFMGFYDDIPASIYESAIIDGCSEYSVFWHIAVKLVLPGFVVASILIFNGSWNEFTLALILTFSDNMRTLPIGIANMIVTDSGQTPFGAVAATGTIALLPALILSLTTQKYIVRGLTAGAVKG